MYTLRPYEYDYSREPFPFNWPAQVTLPIGISLRHRAQIGELRPPPIVPCFCLRRWCRPLRLWCWLYVLFRASFGLGLVEIQLSRSAADTPGTYVLRGFSKHTYVLRDGHTPGCRVPTEVASGSPATGGSEEGAPSFLHCVGPRGSLPSCQARTASGGRSAAELFDLPPGFAWDPRSCRDILFYLYRMF